MLRGKQRKIESRWINCRKPAPHPTRHTWRHFALLTIAHAATPIATSQRDAGELDGVTPFCQVHFINFCKWSCQGFYSFWNVTAPEAFTRAELLKQLAHIYRPQLHQGNLTVVCMFATKHKPKT